MVNRSRTRTIAGPSGTFQQIPKKPGISSVSFSRDSLQGRHACDDIIPGFHNPFLVNHQTVSGATVSCQIETADYVRICSEFPLGYFQSYGGGIVHQSLPGQPSNSALANSLVAAINPSRPSVDLPAFFWELRELPQLIKSSGDALIKRLAGANLKVEFGLKPLVSDVMKLFKFQDEVEKRMKVLSDLHAGPMLRKASLWSGAVETRPGNLITTNSSPTQANFRHTYVSYITTRRVWGYGIITPSMSFLRDFASDADLRSLSRRIVGGLTLDLSTLWNVLPWSWLIDWFHNVGDYLSAQRNLVDCTFGTLRICRLTTSERHYSLYSSSVGLGAGGHTCTTRLVTKERILATPSLLPSAKLPLLSGRQLGILSSLSVLRR